LAKLKLEPESETAGAIPVPERDTVCGLFAALSVMVRLAVRVPRAEGEKVMLIGQLAAAATELPQILLWA
jgi:hypothetical protein